MSPSELQDVKKIILYTAIYYNRELRPEVLLMMADDLKEFHFSDVSREYEKYRKDPKNKTFPLPAQIIEKINPTISDDGTAKETSSRIISAVGKFGWTNPIDAKNYIGELGWHVVNRWGGWEYICANLGVTLELTTFQAQTRDLVKASREMISAGVFDQPTQIENKKQQSTNLESAGSILKLLTGEKNEFPTRT